MTQRVAVYGTLKKDHNNHRVLGKDAELIGTGHTKSKFAMTGLYFVPMVYKAPELGHIQVEVYDVPDDQLIKGPIDRLEGNGFVYNREKTKIVMGKEEVDAWLYFSARVNETKHPDEPNEEEMYNWSGIRPSKAL